MTIEISRDGFFYPYAVPIADAYMSSVPKSITKLWLRGDESSLTTGDDLNVSLWSDNLSGIGLSFSQSTESNKPRKKIGSANGHNSIFFNGISSGQSKYLIDTPGNRLGALLGSLIHLFIVFKIPLSSIPTSTQVMFGNYLNASGGQVFGIRPNTINASQKLGFIKSTTGSIIMDSTNSVQANTWIIGEWQIKGNQPDSSIYINSNLEDQTTLSGQGTNSSQHWTIGTLFNSIETTKSEIEIAEIICMNQIMTNPTNVRNYLSLRYNIPLVYP